MSKLDLISDNSIGKAAMGFFEQFFGKGLGLKLAGMADQLLAKRKARKCYEQSLREELGTIRIIGSPDIDSVAVDLLDTFVSLSISPTWRSERQFDSSGQEPAGHLEREQKVQGRFPLEGKLES